MPDELSLVRFSVVNFFAVILASRPFSPISSLLIKLVSGLILAEPEPDKEIQNRINWIYENTHEKVKVNLPVIELAVFRNLDKGLNREIDIGNKNFYLFELYKYLDEVSKELTGIVISIAKRYSLDIPTEMYGSGKTQTINFSGL